MPDITMCPDAACPLAKTCYRSKESGTKPTGYFDQGEWKEYQTYFLTSPRKGEECAYYSKVYKRADNV